MNYFDYKDGHLKSEDIFITNITKEVHTPFYCYSAKGLKTNFNILKDEWIIGKDKSVNYITQFRKI